MNQPLVTIIVPVYKVEKYLRRCLDSIIAQTYTNFEAILVDDGSPDRCGEICDAYAAKDTRFRVIHQKNGGLSAARNSALNSYYSSARGYGYITFVDSNDYISPEMLDIMVKRAIAGGFDIVRVGYNHVLNDGRITFASGNWDDSTDTRAIQIKILKDELPNGVIGVLFADHLWREKRFPVGITMEDFYISVDIYMEAQKVCVMKQPHYFYNNGNEDSIMRTVDIKKIIQRQYNWFLGWRRHGELAEQFLPEQRTFCMVKALHKAVRAGLMDQGEGALSPEQYENILAFVRGSSNLPMSFALWCGRTLLLSKNIFLLKMVGYIQRRDIIRRTVQKNKR